MGFEVVRQEGSHIRTSKGNVRLTVPVVSGNSNDLQVTAVLSLAFRQATSFREGKPRPCILVEGYREAA